MGESDRPPRGTTILIVEHDYLTATTLQHGLIAAGYDVQRATSANEAIATLESTQADLILIGLMLPDADGLILCSMLKARYPAPIIVLSSCASDVDRALALECGALDLLTTPFDLDEVLAQVSSVVSAVSGARTGAARSG